MQRLKVAVTTLSLLLAACAVHHHPQGPSLDDVRAVSPALAHNTQALLLGEVWRRPGLSPRDRSLVTVSALIANGQMGQLAAHLNRAMDNGLTQPQAAEMLTQLAFYAGWPNVFTAVPVVNGVFASRQPAPGNS